MDLGYLILLFFFALLGIVIGLFYKYENSPKDFLV